MRVALFVPCYVDQFYPRVGLAAADLLQRHGCEVVFPEEQTCCGQPMANTGCVSEARPLAEKFFHVFRGFDHVVCPSGSCTAMVRKHYHDFAHGDAEFEALCGRTYELCEFLHDVLGVRSIDGAFPHRVGLHQSCHGLRELRLGACSERVAESPNKVRLLLEGLEGISFSELERPDECCGFGGTFAVSEEAVSCMMGNDRLADHERAGTEVLTAADMSCLMHLEGLLRRQNKPLRVMHVAEILAEAATAAARPSPSGTGDETPTRSPLGTG